MLFHLGALLRLNDAGCLPKPARISSVSGGSVPAGMLGLAWSKVSFDPNGVRRRFELEVVEPVRRLASKTTDFGAVVPGALGPGTVRDPVASAYQRHLFTNFTLQDLPDAPRFVIKPANLQSRVLWRIAKSYAWDYRVGKIEKPKIELTVEAMVSSAFPPFLSPAVLRHKNSEYFPTSGLDLQRNGREEHPIEQEGERCYR